MSRSMRERLDQIKEEGRKVELYFTQSAMEPPSYYTAEVLEVGEDYVEFNAYDHEGAIAARNVMPLNRLTGITLTCVEMVREGLLRMGDGRAG